MSIRHQDVTGKRSGMLTAIYRTPEKTNHNDNVWFCRCDCGGSIKLSTTRVNSGKTKHCGCRKIDKESDLGKAKIRIRHILTKLKNRCYNVNNTSYKDYGGRGITVCDRWLESSENFYNDMVGTYFDGASIDRINVNGNYEINNVRWATDLQQARNKRSNVTYEIDGSTKCITEWSEFYNISMHNLRHWLSKGLNIKQSIIMCKNPSTNYVVLLSPHATLSITNLRTSFFTNAIHLNYEVLFKGNLKQCQQELEERDISVGWGYPPNVSRVL